MNECQLISYLGKPTKKARKNNSNMTVIIDDTLAYMIVVADDMLGYQNSTIHLKYQQILIFKRTTTYCYKRESKEKIKQRIYAIINYLKSNFKDHNNKYCNS